MMMMYLLITLKRLCLFSLRTGEKFDVCHVWLFTQKSAAKLNLYNQTKTSFLCVFTFANVFFFFTNLILAYQQSASSYTFQFFTTATMNIK